MELGSRWLLRRLVRRNFAGSQWLFCNGLQLREHLPLRALNQSRSCLGVSPRSSAPMLPTPSLYLAPIRRLIARLSLPGLAGLAALVLASCAGQDQYAQQAGRTRVHPRVARAQARPIQGIDVSRFQGKVD